MANINGTQTSWYTHSYGGPFRSNRLRAPSLLPQSRLNGAQVTTVQQTLVVDAQRQNGTAESDENKNVRRRETIFGPDVGEDDEPGWAKPVEGAKIDVNVVKGWVEKAKSEEGLHATTTLQALVNLKRPTLLLQQLEIEQPRADDQSIEGEITSASSSRPTSMVPTAAPLHSLKFNYDATTPLVNISLSIYPAPPVPVPEIEGKEAPSIVEEEPKVVYSGVHNGGFNQVFQLPPEYAMDLSSAITPLATQPNASSANISNGEDEKNLPASVSGVRESEDTGRSSLGESMANLHVTGATQPDLATVPEVSTQEATEERRPPRRFGIFPRRGNREQDPEAGAIELQNRENAEEAKEEENKEPETGMRLLIRIEAVGPEGQALTRRNAQLTHILVTGMWVPEAGSTAPPGQNGKRVWVVKVVRREAIIGAHTFLLKEIYGLSSSTQTQQTSYPPTGGDDPYASTPNECIVCLTSPRDVVLLPCRHLVVCRDCAVGMVEFGAGGKVARREDAAAEGGDAAAAGTLADPAVANTTTAVLPQVAGGTTATGRERRKKKAKGWYCPVCRQPYTSLLRLALPGSAKPLRTPAASRLQSRAPSIRSVHSTHTLRRVPSIAPTLPDGAEEMLDRLRPEGADADVDADELDGREEAELQRPQFVLGAEIDAEDEKGQSEHREFAGSSTGQNLTRDQELVHGHDDGHVHEHDYGHQAEAGRKSLEGKGWKEAA